MARHHYVPQSVLREFVSADAWMLMRGDLDEARLQHIKHNDARSVSNPKAKHLPLCVLRKGPDGTRLTRGTVRETCSTNGFYGLVQYEDPVLRGVLRNTIDGIANKTIASLDVAGLRRLGAKPLDVEEIESRFVGKLDGPFAAVAASARRKERLNGDQLNALRRSLVFARSRTPAWRAVRHPEIEATHVARAKERLRGYDIIDKEALHADGYTLETLLSVFDDNLFVIGAVLAATGHTDFFKKHDVRVSFLHATGDLRFVTCDNPMRPYIIDIVGSIAAEGDPGFGNPAAMATYPLSPTCCAFVAGHELMPHGNHGSVDDRYVRKINTAHLLMAHQEVVLPGPDVDGLFEPWVDLSSIGPPRRP